MKRVVLISRVSIDTDLYQLDGLVGSPDLMEFGSRDSFRLQGDSDVCKAVPGSCLQAS
jgi:hypothetical protein